jgi:hypothetical protein
MENYYFREKFMEKKNGVDSVVKNEDIEMVSLRRNDEQQHNYNEST